MAVRVIFGGPRSGKSYFAVHHLVNTFYDLIDGEYTLKDKYKDLKIITNIEKLKLPHIDLDEAINNTGGVSQFFSYDNQKKIFEKYPQVVYVIDEAQMKFPDNFRDHKVFNWLQYHGHWGQDVYFLTQDKYLLPRQITVLSELTIKALPRSTSLTGGRDLRYNVMLGNSNEVGDKKILIKNKKIFALYKSQDSEESQKARNPFLKYLVALFVLMLFAAGQYMYFFKSRYSNDAIASQRADNEKIQSTHRAKNVNESQPTANFSSSSIPRKYNSTTSAAAVDTLVPYTLSYITQDDEFIIIFDGQFYPLELFPYTINRIFMNSIIAMIPAHIYDRLKAEENEPDSQPIIDSKPDIYAQSTL